MAKQDVRIVTGIDLAPIRKDFGELLQLAKTQGKLVADALSQALSTDVLAGLEKALKGFKVPAGTGGASTGRSTGGGSSDPEADAKRRQAAAERANQAIAAAEIRANNLRETLSKKTTAELIDDMDRLQQRKKAIVAAMATEEDRASKAQLARQKKAVDEELAIVSERARKRPEVISGGAGAGVGLPGVGRNLIGGLGKDIGASLLTGFSVAGIGAAFAEVVAQGSEFDKGLKSLQSITGVSGDALTALGTDARNLAKEFGGSASANIESFKGVLSRLGPSLPADQLGNITRSINTLSAATGDDAVASMDALTSSILQFQVPLDGTVDVGNEAARMMNVLAAGAQQGAAEVPDVAAAIKVAGVAASGAKVSFEETNAAIQALAAGGKVGAEAGTALRNVLGKLGEGRFLPKDTQKELKGAGVDIAKLSDTSVPLTTRLRELQKIQGDAALVTKLFGTENAAAASILLRSVDSIDDLTTKITGTQSAFEQAAVNQSSFAAGFDRFKAQVSDAAIGVFQAIGPALGAGLSLAGDAITLLIDGFKGLLGFVSENSTVLGILAGVVGVYAVAANVGGIATIALSAAQVGSTAVLGAVKAGWATLNAVMAANPIGAAIAGVALLVGGLIALSDALEETVDDQLAQAEAEQKLVDLQKESNKQAQARATQTQKLASEYEKLASNTKRTVAEEKRLGEVQQLLNKDYPGLISSTKTFSQNLADVKGASDDARLALKSLNAEMAALDKQSRDIQIRTLGLKLNTALTGEEGLANAVRDGVKGFAGIGGASLTQALVTELGNSLKSTKTDNEVIAAVNKFNERIQALAQGQQITLGGETFTADITPEEELAIKERAAKVAEAALALRAFVLNETKTPAGGAEGGTTDPPPPPPGEPKEALNFAERTAEARRKAAALLAEVDIKNAKDERERIQSQAKEKRRLLDEQLELDIKRADKEAAAAEKEGRNVEGLGAFKDELRRIAKLERDKATTDEQGALRDLSQKLLDDELKAASAAAQARKDAAQAELDTLIAQQETLGVVTSEGLKKRLELQRAARAEERLLTIANIVSQDAEFKKQFDDLQKGFDSGDIADEATLRQKVAELRARFAAAAEGGPALKLFDATSTKDEAAAETEIRVKTRQEEIDRLATLEERQRAEALAAIDDELQTELARFANNEEAKNEVLRKAASERAAIEKTFLEQTNDLYRLANALRTSLEEAFTATVDKESEKRLQESLDKNADDLQDLKEKYVQGLVSTREYNAQLIKIQEDRLKLEQGEDAKKNNALVRAAELFADSTTKVAQKAGGDLVAINDEIVQLKLSKEGKTAEEQAKIQLQIAAKEAEVADKRAGVFQGMAAQVGASFLSLLAQGEVSVKSFGAMMFDVVDSAVPGIVALIFGQSLGLLGPILGPIASGLAIATFKGLIALARNEVIGNAQGDIRIKGPGTRTSDSILRRLSVDESVVSAKGTLATGNEDALRWMNKGNSIFEYPGLRMSLPKPELRYDLSRLVVTQDGIRQQSEVAYRMAAAAHASSNETNSKLDTVIHELSAIRARTKMVADNTGDTARNTGKLVKKPDAKSSGFVG